MATATATASEEQTEQMRKWLTEVQRHLDKADEGPNLTAPRREALAQAGKTLDTIYWKIAQGIAEANFNVVTTIKSTQRLSSSGTASNAEVERSSLPPLAVFETTFSALAESKLPPKDRKALINDLVKKFAESLVDLLDRSDFHLRLTAGLMDLMEDTVEKFAAAELEAEAAEAAEEQAENEAEQNVLRSQIVTFD